MSWNLVNASTGAACSLYFTPCCWFSYGRYEVRLILGYGGVFKSFFPFFPLFPGVDSYRDLSLVNASTGAACSL